MAIVDLLNSFYALIQCTQKIKQNQITSQVVVHTNDWYPASFCVQADVLPRSFVKFHFALKQDSYRGTVTATKQPKNVKVLVK